MADPTEGNLVQLSGPVTLYESNEIRETLLAETREDGTLTLDLATTGPWDLAGLQLLIATVFTAAKNGNPVRFVEVPKSLAEIANRAGLADWLKGFTDSYHNNQPPESA